MKNFKVTVNGNIYDVSVEELRNNEQAAAPVSAPKTGFAPSARDSVIPAPIPVKKAAPEHTVSVLSPMPGVILDIKVAVGQKVEANQVALLLEAMKMENEIVVPEAGTVVSIEAAKGASVDTGAVLITISK